MSYHFVAGIDFPKQLPTATAPYFPARAQLGRTLGDPGQGLCPALTDQEFMPQGLFDDYRIESSRLSWSGLLALGLVPSVPTIQPSARSVAYGEVDPRDKPEDDSAGVWIASSI